MSHPHRSSPTESNSDPNGRKFPSESGQRDFSINLLRLDKFCLPNFLEQPLLVSIVWNVPLSPRKSQATSWGLVDFDKRITNSPRTVSHALHTLDNPNYMIGPSLCKLCGNIPGLFQKFFFLSLTS